MRKLTSKWILYRGQKLGNGLNDDRIGCIRTVHKRSEVTKISGEEMSGMAAHSRLEDNPCGSGSGRAKSLLEAKMGVADAHFLALKPAF